MVVVEVRERLAVNKQGSQRFDMERFNLKKLNRVEGKEQFCVEVSNRFAALEDFDTEVDSVSACRMAGEYQNFSRRETRLLFHFTKRAKKLSVIIIVGKSRL
jgi:hypothetical protein